MAETVIGNLYVSDCPVIPGGRARRPVPSIPGLGKPQPRNWQLNIHKRGLT